MSKDFIFGFLFLMVGLFSLVSSIKDWNFFFESVKAEFVVNIFGRIGARFFYGLVGIALITLGLFPFVGINF